MRELRRAASPGRGIGDHAVDSVVLDTDTKSVSNSSINCFHQPNRLTHRVHFIMAVVSGTDTHRSPAHSTP